MSATIDDAQPAETSPLDDDTSVAAPLPEPESEAAEQETWQVPPAQPLRLIAAVLLLVGGAVSYGYALMNFWSSPRLGIHLAIPYPAYLLIAAGLLLSLAALRVALGLWSPHAKLALAGIAFLACVTFAIGGGRFVSYTLRGTRNPPYRLALAVGDRFPDFRLGDQSGVMHDATMFGAAPLTLVVIYRGDFCPFARFELGDLSDRREELRKAGIQIVAISADPPERSTMLARFLNTNLPLLSDSSEALLNRLGLVQHYANHQPDSAIPAYFLVDKKHRVRWVFTSPWYREVPPSRTILDAAQKIHAQPPRGGAA
jgi:peroxiredoxin